MSELFGKWIPISVSMRSKYNYTEFLPPKLAFIERLKNGMVIAHPIRIYAIPAPICFVIDPKLIKTPLDNIKKFSIIELENDFDALARITIRETKKPLTIHFKEPAKTLNIELIKPREFLRPILHKLVIISLPVKNVGSGAVRKADVDERSAEYLIWSVSNASPTGNHAIQYLVFLAPPNEKIRIHYTWHGAKKLLVDEFIEL